MRSPDTAIRTGPNARRGCDFQAVDECGAQGCLNVGGGEVPEGAPGFDCGGEDLRCGFLELLACVVWGGDLFVSLEEECEQAGCFTEQLHALPGRGVQLR